MTITRAADIEDAIKNFKWRFSTVRVQNPDRNVPSDDANKLLCVYIKATDGFTRAETEEIQKIIGANAYKIENDPFGYVVFKVY